MPAAAGPATHRVDLDLGPADPEIIAASLMDKGALGIWERPGELVAWFTEPIELVVPGDAATVREVSSTARWSVEPDRDWQAEWKATISPVRAGRTVVVPSWLIDEHEAGPDDLTVVLDPGRAFGSGHHATTTLCLELLDELDLAGRLAGRTISDVGCGSGILAIAAAARGANVVGVDIDADAIAVTRENAARNAVTVTTYLGSVAALPERAEIVVANLVTDVIAELAPQLLEATTDTLIVSGITVERQHIALEALRDAGLRDLQQRARDGWIAVHGRQEAAALA